MWDILTTSIIMTSTNDISLDHTTIHKACTRKDLLENDRISDLSDDILIHILSPLTLKEAFSTSVLSKRWRNVWTYVPSLNFYICHDYLKELIRRKAPASEKLEKQREEENKYVRWVDAIMSSHKATIIDEFKVRFYLKENWKENIDNWLRIATEKRVRRLQLDIGPIKGDPRCYSSLNPLSYNLPSLSPGAPLTSLELNFIDVTGDTVEKLLHDIPTLEVVSIMNSRSLVSLKVSGPGLHLKSLKLIRCMRMKQLTISAPNLISFDYSGPLFLSSPFISTPKLAELFVHGEYGCYILDHLMYFSSILSQIQVLSLRSHILVGYSLFSEVYPSGQQIKMLEISFPVQSEGQLLDISSLIFCCPLLLKFVLQADTYNEELNTDPILWCDVWKFEEEDRSKAHPHRHLKIVEMTGSSCTESELRFLKYITKHAVSLEKLIIRPGSPHIRPVDEARIRAKEKAEQWRTILKPARGHLEIL